jgi:hypothetical protein
MKNIFYLFACLLIFSCNNQNKETVTTPSTSSTSSTDSLLYSEVQVGGVKVFPI